MVLTALSLAGPFCRLRWITRSTMNLLDQTPAQTELCSPRNHFSGELAAAELCSGGFRRPAPLSANLGRRISIGRPSETRARVNALTYRSALEVLQNNPCFFLK